MSKLIPKELLSKIPELYDTTNTIDPICQVKLFMPYGNFTWYIIELSVDKDVCYGYVVGLENELGYFSLKEIEDIKGSFSLQAELDTYFTPTKLSVIKAQNE